MIARKRLNPYFAVRTTDSGLPPTPTQAGMGFSVEGNTCWFDSAERVVPCQVTGWSRRSFARSSSFSSKRTS